MAEQTVEDKLKELETAKATLAEQVKKGETAAAETAKKVEQLTGQLSLLSEAAKEVTQTKEEAPDFNMEPEKALDYHFRKRTAPIIAASNAREAAREKELTKIRNKEDWAEFGDSVDAFIAKNGIPNDTLATPGAYEGILKLVKSEKIDEIVKKKVAAEVAAYQETAAKAATSGATGAAKSADAGKPAAEPELTDQEKSIAKKLGVSEKAWMETSKGTTFDGVRIRGPVLH